MLFALGCGKKDTVKPSQDSILATQAITTIKTIKKAYEEKNEALIRKHLGALLAENTIMNFSFQSTDLDLTPRLVKLNDKSLEVNLTWYGTWWLEKGEKVNNRGVADFVFHQKTMKLTYIEGDNPFLIPFTGMRKIKEQR
jgi:hypothetical protein